MRINHGNFAYELEKISDPRTNALKGWEYRIHRVQPYEKLLYTKCCSPTREVAEREALQIVILFEEQERLQKLSAA